MPIPVSGAASVEWHTNWAGIIKISLMFKHHLLLTFRNFKRYKSSFFINLTGLSAGLTCALLICLWVISEMETDRFHSSRIYQVVQNEHLGGAVNTVEGTPGILADALAEEIPGVESAVTASPGFWLAQSRIGAKGQPALKAAGRFAGADFFKVFSYPLLSGNKENVLSGRNTVVISESLARKLFGTTNVTGKELMWTNTEMEAESLAQITGVFKDLPPAASEKFDFLVSLDVMLRAGNGAYTKWGNYGPQTFVLLKDNTDPARFNDRISGFMKSKGQENYTLLARPYADAYLYNRFENGKVAGGRIDYVRLFSLIAVFIVLIACINFMNLATARASRRLKEIGVKKAMGASRASLIMQYLLESLLIAFMALIISLVATALLLPEYNRITGKALSLQFDARLVSGLLVIAIVTGLISGSYPALYLSGLKPVRALTGKLNLSAVALWARQGLVVFQFAFSVILIVAVLIVHKQMEYVQHKNQGYDREHVLYFEIEGTFRNRVNYVVDAVKGMHGVVNASSIDRELLGDLSYTTGTFGWEGRNEEEMIRFQRADVNTGLIETLGITMKEGRSFSAKFGADSTAIIINEAGIRAMRLKDPVGKVFTLWGNDMQIIGVMADFHFESMHKKVGPMFMRYKPGNTNRVMVKVAGGRVSEVVKQLERFIRAENPGFPFDYKFLDQDFQAQYAAENKVAALSGYFAILAIVISCMGLFGLSAFAAERRFKEVGIRKVLGASSFSVIFLLSRDFTRPVLLAILIALPLGYVLSHNWLSSYAYHVDMQYWFFLAAGGAAFLISALAVLFQAWKAAGANPARAMRAE